MARFSVMRTLPAALGAVPTIPLTRAVVVFEVARRCDAMQPREERA